MPYRPVTLRAALLAFLLVPSVSLAMAATQSVETEPAPLAADPGDAMAPDVLALLGEAPVAALLERLGPDVVLFGMHLDTLANPFFEGRGATTLGNERAADYIAFHFERIGLEPPFGVTESVDGVEVQTPRASFSQPFAPTEVRRARRTERPVRIESAGASMRVGEGPWGELIEGLDFAVLGCSGSGEVEAPIVFVGYSIPAGEGGYLGYAPGTDLSGKVAVALRYEPLNEEGASRWAGADDTWSLYAQLEPKVSAAARRGAAGFILVNPPGLPGEEASRLATVAETGGAAFEIPVVMLSQERADFLLSRADPEGRSLLELRRLVDETPAVIDMPGATVRLRTEVDRTPDMTRNVGGLLPGRGSLADEIVVVGAHFDHAGYGQYGGRVQGVLHPGADDNASGTSAVLLAAERLSEVYAELPEDAEARSILFLAFSAEEWGLLGSRYYCDNPIAPIEQHVFMLNMDMMGRVRENVLMVGGQTTAEGLDQWLEPFLAEGGFDYQPLPRGVFGRSDHASFFRAGVPCLFFFSGFHDDYHAPGDVASLINRVGAVRVSTMGREIVLAMATRPDRPEFVEDDGTGRRTDRPPVGRPSAQRVRFGVQPGYTTDGRGVLIENVFPGTSAAEAGLRPGDVMTAWNDAPLTGVEDWMPLLRESRPGDEVRVTFRRGEETLTGTVTLQASGSGG